MLQGAMIFGMVLSVCWIVSTKEQREAAKKRMGRFTLRVWIGVAAVWAVILLWPWDAGRH